MIKNLTIKLGLNLSNSKDRKKVTISLFVIFILIFGLITFLGENKNDNVNIIESEQIADESNAEVTAVDSQNDAPIEIPPLFVYVDVSGAVQNPGVIALPANSRVNDAIEAAGGLTSNASTKSINRAVILNDGEKIYIPTEDEEETYIPNVSDNIVVQSGNVSDGKVNINTANSEELQTLNGVGPSTAQKIIDFREQNGKFQNIEDLMNVSGIGQKTYEKLKTYITV